jgi:hypothetical protein
MLTYSPEKEWMKFALNILVGATLGTRYTLRMGFLDRRSVVFVSSRSHPQVTKIRPADYDVPTITVVATL